MLIESRSDLQVVYEGSGLALEVAELLNALVDVLVIDQRLETSSGIEFVQAMREKLGNPDELPGLILTAPYESVALRLLALEAGFDNLVTLEEGPEAIIGAIGQVAAESMEVSIVSLFELISRVKPEPEMDLEFVSMIEALDAESSQTIAKVQKAWSELSNGDGTSLNSSVVRPLLAELGLRTPAELIIRMYRGGLLVEL